LITFMVALALLIAVALTVGSYVQMRRQMIEAGITGQITNAAGDATRQIKSWMEIRSSIVSAGVDAITRMDDPMPGIIQTGKSGKFQAAYLGTADKRMLGDHDMGLPGTRTMLTLVAR
jgi:methyl-accepting chemotaxis protein